MVVFLFPNRTNHTSYDYQKSSLTFASEYQKYTGDGIASGWVRKVDDAIG
jgi:hypothetical protein